MKKRLLSAGIQFFTVFCFFLSTEVYGAADWQWQNPLPHGNSYYNVWGSSGNDVFAVGSGGLIYHYDGSSWSDMTTRIDDSRWFSFQGVWGSSGNDVFAVGYPGIIFHYNGINWSEMDSGTYKGFSGVCVWGSSGSDVFAVGDSGTILHYNGTEWSAMTSGTAYGLSGVWGSSGNDVFAVGGSGTILHYNGTEWSAMTSGTASYLSGVWGSSGNDVFAVGVSGTILHYNGTEWSAMTSGTAYGLSGVWGSSGNDVFAVGGYGYNVTIFHYNGTEWSAMLNGTDYHLSKVWGSSGNDVFAVSYDGTILHFDGNNWTTQIARSGILNLIGTYGNIEGIWGNSDNDVFAVGRSDPSILHYNGTEWSAITECYHGLSGVWGSYGADVFAVGDAGKILHYNGTEWTAMTSGTASALKGIWGSSGNDVFTVGDAGTILHYNGTEWTAMTSGTASVLNGIWGSSGADVFAVGDAGTILHYNGTEWTAMTSGTASALKGIWGSSGKDVFAVGDSGTILHYDGRQWSPMLGINICVFKGVWGSSGNDVFAVGDFGIILHYDGTGWSAMTRETVNSLLGVWGSSGNDVFAVGTNFTILHYPSESNLPPIIADFSASATIGLAPVTVQFTDLSTGNPISWNWDFNNDGVTDSTEQNPSFTYDSADKYSVKLTVTNSYYSSDEEIKTDYIEVYPPIVADFEASATSGLLPFTVTFSDTSTGNPTSWQWDFNNDGIIDSTEQNPSYTYSSKGIYTVKLTASNQYTSDAEVKTGYIRVFAPANANFTAKITAGHAPLTVGFQDKSEGETDSFQWDFNNDGITDSTEKNPSFTYLIQGNYTVKLTAANPFSSDEEVKTDYIQVAPPLPDLKITQIQNSQAVSGQTIEVTWTVANSGTGFTNTPVWYDRIWISPDIDVRMAQPEDMLLGEFENLSYLAPGESYVQTKQVKVPAGLNGVYYLFVVTDNYDAYDVNVEKMEAYTHSGTKVNLVSETNDKNNINFKEIQIVPPPASDLNIILPIVSPVNAFSGERIHISYTVKNTGNNITNADSWWDSVYLSKDTALNTSTATLLGKYKHAEAVENTGRLEPGSAYTIQADVSVPQKIYGDYYIYVVTDIYDNVYEQFGENNNTVRNEQAIVITLTPPPDLVVSAITAPDAAGSGQTINIQWTVENQGAGNPFESYWNDCVYLYSGSPLDPDAAVRLRTFGISTALDAGESYTQTENVKIPDGLEGLFYLYVKTDCNDQVFEHQEEDNNVTAAPTRISISLSPWPDLKVIPAQKTESTTAGQKIDISFTVANEGNAPASGIWTDHVYISNESEWSGNGISLKTVSHTGPLNAGESYNQIVSVPVPNELSGQYYVYVVTDEGNRVYEHTDENNNVSQICSLTVQPYPPIDLVLSQPEISAASVSSGQSVTLTWSVSNQGQGATLTSNWYDAVYLSADNLLNPNEDRLLKTVIHSGALSPQQSYSSNTEAVIPNGIGGQYYLIVKTDNDNGVSEVNETNNLAASPISVTMTPSPDLQITGAVIPSEGKSGQPLAVSWTVENKGAGSTSVSAWYDGIYLSSDASLGAEDIHLASVSRSGILSVSGTYTATQEVEIPIYASGYYYLFIKTDARDDVYEHNAETNNFVKQLMQVTLPPPSDLVVTDITVPANAVPGEPVTITWTVKNQGTNPAAGRMSEAVYISENSQWEFTDLLLGVISRDIELSPGASMRMSMRANLSRAYRSNEQGIITEILPGVAVGTYYVCVKTDVKNNIKESDENNNVGVSATLMNVDVPVLMPDTSVTTEILENQKKYYSITVAEGLDLLVSLNGSISEASNEIYIAYDRVPTLSDYDYAGIVPFESDQEIMVPTTKAGRYYLLVVARDLPQGIDSEEITLSAELMSFSLTGMNPAAGGAGGRVTCTLNGAGFRETTQAFLRKADGSMLEGKLVEFVSTMQMKVRWDLTDVALGTYDVVVKNADGSIVEYPKGFTVETSTGMQVETATLSADTFRAGALAPMTFQFKNTGNIDIPYLKISILIPSYVIPKSIENTNSLLKKSDLIPSDIDTSIKDYSFVISDFDNSNMESNRIDFIAMNCYPGSILESKILFQGLRIPIFPVHVLYSPLDISEYVLLEVTKIENIRQNILQHPEKVSKNIMSAAQSKIDFRNMILNSYLYNKLIDYDIFNQILADSGFDSSFSRKRIASLLRKTTTEISNPLDCNPIECPSWIEYICIIDKVEEGALAWIINQETEGISCSLFVKIFCSDMLVGGIDKVRRGMAKCYNVHTSVDPNEIIGPSGYDAKKWVSKDSTLPYNILFENDPELATAPAQEVSIRQALDPDLDARSFRLSSFGFGEFVFTVPANRSFYSNRLDLTDSLGIYVDVSAGIDINTNEAFWIFRSIDPITGQAPANPFAGFLPVNDPATGSGQGFVSYTIKPGKQVQTGDVIDAQATIVFDINEAIDTPAIFNTIDADAPASQLQSTADFTNDTTFTLNWSGQDAEGGSGLKDYSLYMSVDDQPYEIYQSNLTDISLMITVEPKHHYRFFIIANDNAGNMEAMKTQAELLVDLGALQAPTANAGQDQAVDEATAVTLNGSASSDPDGSIVSFHWTQIQGPAVTLSNPNAPNPAFTAPDVDSNEIYLIFQLTVKDNDELEDRDTIVIYIKNTSFEDTDKDGMADTWEMQYFNTLDKDGTADSDGDGISDLDEYINGTDPTAETRGDINRDKKVDLKDVLTALQIISGINPEAIVIQKAADINADGKIGVEETVYILQSLAGMRDSRPYYPLIFDYNVSNGERTAITVKNTSGTYAAVSKVMFKSYPSDIELLGFMVYLLPGDIWTGEIREVSGKPLLYSTDENALVSANVWASAPNPIHISFFTQNCNSTSQPPCNPLSGKQGC